VFFISSVLTVAFVIVVLMFQEGAADALGALRPWLTSTFD
jgi:BCCT family betaine/carnitine transporter